MDDGKLQGFWEGKRSAMAAAREKAREHAANRKYVDELSVLASAHYSRATTLRARGKCWFPFVAWHFLWARVYARKLSVWGINALSPEQSDVAGTILLKGPFPDIIAAVRCFNAGIEKIQVGKTKPHTIALLYIGRGECLELGDSPSKEFFAPHAFHDAAALISRIEKEEPDIHGKRQLIRVLRRCGTYFAERVPRCIDDRSLWIMRGDEFLLRAEELAREVSSDQLAKLKARG